MPRVVMGIQTTGAEQFRDLAKKFRKQGQGELRRKLTAAIRAAGQDAVQAARDSIMSQTFESEGLVADSRGVRTSVSSHRGGGQKHRTAQLVERASTERAKTRALKRDTGLRSTIARNVKLSVTATGVRIVVPKGIVPGWTSPARDSDNPKGWRHPVFGNKEVWVAEKAGSWFAKPIQEKTPQFRQALLDAMNEVSSELDT